MLTAPMKEIRIPSALIRERRSSIAYILAKSFCTALVLAAIAFFAVNAAAIALLGFKAAAQHRMADFSIAYRYFAAPAAVGIFGLSCIGALTFFLRERKH